MKVRVLFFAYLRDITKAAQADIEVAGPAQVRDVWQAVVSRWPALETQLVRLPIVVDGRVVELDAPVAEGAEVVWLPPVGGGSAHGLLAARITSEALDPARLLSQVSAPNCGGIVVFVGEVREMDEGRRVAALEYQAYASLAEEQLRSVGGEALARWPEARIALEHRVGRLVVGEASVVVAVACPHRAEAFECARYLIDRVKEAIPIWKREEGEDEGGVRWLEGHQYRP